MATNIEIKARLRDRNGVEVKAAEVADGPRVVMQQEDTFFSCNHGRLKLRKEGAGKAQLIYYERADKDEPKPSYYSIIPVEDPQVMTQSLGKALGILGQVKKERTLYLTGSTRIHLDRVVGLGDFMELEVVLGEDLTHEEGKVVAQSLMLELGISHDDLVAEAYIDLLKKRALLEKGDNTLAQDCSGDL